MIKKTAIRSSSDLSPRTQKPCTCYCQIVSRVAMWFLLFNFMFFVGDCHLADGDDRFACKFRASFSDESVLYGDVHYGKAELVAPEPSLIDSREHGTKISVISGGWVLDDGENYIVIGKGADIVVSERKAVTIMFLAKGIPQRKFQSPQFVFSDGFLKVKFVNDEKKIGYSMAGLEGHGLGRPNLDTGYFVKLWAGFDIKTEVMDSGVEESSGTIATVSSSRFEFPVRDFAFAIKDFDEMTVAINRFYSDLCSQPALTNGITFPINEEKAKKIAEKLDKSSNLAALITSSKRYTNALNNHQFNDEQFIDECIAIIAGTKPIASEWLVDAMEQHLNKVRPTACVILRRKLDESRN